MTAVLINGALTFVVGLLILRPFSMTGRRAPAGASTAGSAAGDGRRRELLRQLRDLDDDLAVGKLTHADHERLRGPVEREAAVALRREAPPATADPPKDRDVGGAPRWRARTVMLLAMAAAAASITFLLINAVSSRTAGQAITGDSIPGATQAESPTRQHLAAVVAAQAQVKQDPKDVNAHLALAAAYTAAGAHQLAIVEYLAVTRLDPANAEANTSLALLAFQVGHAAQAKAMVDRVLAADPNYPEALYVRGLVNLIGLRRAGDAARDFSAYLAVAPFGSHRTDAVTLLALAVSQEHR